MWFLPLTSENERRREKGFYLLESLISFCHPLKFFLLIQGGREKESLIACTWKEVRYARRGDSLIPGVQILFYFHFLGRHRSWPWVIRRNRLVEMNLGLIFLKSTSARADTSQRIQIRAEGHMRLRSNRFYQHETLQKTISFRIKRVEPIYLGTKVFILIAYTNISCRNFGRN